MRPTRRTNATTPPAAKVAPDILPWREKALNEEKTASARFGVASPLESIAPTRTAYSASSPRSSRSGRPSGLDRRSPPQWCKPACHRRIAPRLADRRDRAGALSSPRSTRSRPRAHTAKEQRTTCDDSCFLQRANPARSPRKKGRPPKASARQGQDAQCFCRDATRGHAREVNWTDLGGAHGRAFQGASRQSASQSPKRRDISSRTKRSRSTSPSQALSRSMKSRASSARVARMRRLTMGI